MRPRAGRGAGALSAFPWHQAITALTKTLPRKSAKIQHSSESVAIVRWLDQGPGRRPAR